jgi:hypothetical protein
MKAEKRRGFACVAKIGSIGPPVHRVTDEAVISIENGLR